MAERASLSTLSSLLAAHGVPMRAIEDAIARQVVHGSDLATNLLEVAGLGEPQLLPVLAAASGLDAAPLGSLPIPPPDVLGLVPVELAQRENIFPISLSQGVLKLAVAEPFVSVDGLLFTQPVTVAQIIAPLPRIRQAVSKAYKIPLDRRFTRLLGKLGEPGLAAEQKLEIDDEPTMISTVASLLSRPTTQTPATLAAGMNPTAAPTLSPEKLQQTPPGPPVRLIEPEPVRIKEPEPVRMKEPDPVPIASPVSSMDFVGAPTIPQHVTENVHLPKSNPLAWATRAPVVQVVEPAQPWRPLTSDDMPETVPAPRLAAMAAASGERNENKTSDEEDAAPVSRRTAALRKETARGRAAGNFFRRAVVGEHKAREQAPQTDAEVPPHERKGSVRVRRKGPFTAQAAEEELAEATVTDGVLDIFFTFAHQFFEYSVLFVVSGDVADGRDASGPGLTAARVKNVKVPLDKPSMLQLARERKAPVTMAPVAHGIDAQIVRDLAREARFDEGDRASIAILPIVVRNRVVALLLGDDGSVDVDLSALGDVIIIAGRTVEALERIILRKKLGAAGGRSPSVAPPPEHAPEPREGYRPVGLAALARALDTNSAADSEGSTSSGNEGGRPVQTRTAPGATMLSAAALRASETSKPPVVRHDQPDVLPRSARQAARSPGTNRAEATSSSGDTNPDGDVPEPAATSERSGPGSRKRRFLNGPTSRPRIAPMAFSESGTESSEQGQPTIQGMPRSQRRGASSGRGRTMVTPRPLPPNLGGKPALRVPPGRNVAVDSSSPTTIAGPPVPPTLAARRSGAGLADTRPEVSVQRSQREAERETVALLQQFVGSNGADNDAGQAIVQLGERAVSAIMVRFPGPLAPGIGTDSTDLPTASSCGPLFALLVAIGPDTVLAVAQRATSILSEDRFWAAHVLGEIVCIESAEVVGTLLFDDDVSVRRIARRSAAFLIATVPDAAQAIVPMLEQAARGSDRPGRRFIAIDTLGELAVTSTIPALIAMLGDPVQDIGDTVHRALVQITCQDFARDTRRWIDWFAANASRHRVEWIIDTLLHDSPELRRIAAEALEPVIGRDLGFDAEASRDERAAAHVRYLLWWEQEGRVQYGPH